MERGMERNDHQSENLLESEPKRPAPRHDPCRMPHDHCPTKRHRLNKFSTFSNLDDWKHESCACISDIHICDIIKKHTYSY